jgi:Uma2 family endonuclease
MTLLQPSRRTKPEATARRKAVRAAATHTLPKPVTADDVADLLDLAERLEGRPVPDVRMTEKEFEVWCDPDVRAEWVGGEVILMSPESFESVDLGGWLNAVLRGFVEHHDLGRLIGRDFMVRLPRQRRRRVPDLLFLAKGRLDLLRPTFLDGAPDLIIELVSPDSQTRDRRDKYDEYQRAGVREYWIIDPAAHHAEAYALGKNTRFRRIEEIDGKLASAALPGFYLRPDWLRRPKLPAVAKLLRELGIRR